MDAVLPDVTFLDNALIFDIVEKQEQLPGGVSPFSPGHMTLLVLQRIIIISSVRSCLGEI